MRVSLGGLDLLQVETRIVVASLKTYLTHARASTDRFRLSEEALKLAGGPGDFRDPSEHGLREASECCGRSFSGLIGVGVPNGEQGNCFFPQLGAVRT